MKTNTPTTKKTIHLFLFSAILSILSFSPLQLIAQHGECGTIETKKDFENRKARKSNPEYQHFVADFIKKKKDPLRSGEVVTSVPVKAHIIRQDNGAGGITALQLEQALATANEFYKNANMEFVLCEEINYIDNTDFYYLYYFQESLLISNHHTDDVINIYFAKTIRNNYCGWAYFPGQGPDVILMDHDCVVSGNTLAHEFGHFFSLPHTHENVPAELVDGSNCTSAGDFFCDTPADPELSFNTVSSSCFYTGNAVDANGDRYRPDTRNIMSYSRATCRNRFSLEQYATMAYTLKTSRAYLRCPDISVDFTASATESCDLPFTVDFNAQSVGGTSFEWDFNNDGTVDTMGQNVSYTFTEAGQYDVNLTISNTQGDTIQRTKGAYIIAGGLDIEYQQDFQTFIVAPDATGYTGGWTTTPANTTNQYRWNTNKNGTQAFWTGPSSDHTLGSKHGIYAYAHSPSGSTGDEAILTSPCFQIPSNSRAPVIEYWYHMAGGFIGSLHVDLYDGNQWISDIAAPLIGAQQNGSQDDYKLATVDLSAYKGQKVQIRFRAVKGNGTGDIAIDDFHIYDSNPIPKISFNQSDFSMVENSESGTVGCRGLKLFEYQLRPTHPISGGDASVSVRPSGTARLSQDYSVQISNPTIPEGSQQTATLEVYVFDDGTVEDTETIELLLTVSGNSDLVVDSSRMTLTISVEDNDPDVNVNGTTQVSNQIGASGREYLGSDSKVFFYDNSGNLIAQIHNNTSWNYGCTTVSIDRNGTGALPFIDDSPEFFASQKSLLVSPTFQNPNNIFNNFDITLYFTDEEITGWETATGNSRTELKLIRSPGNISNVSPQNPFADGVSEESIFFTNGSFSTDHFYVSGKFYSDLGGFAGAKGLGTVPLPVELIEFKGEITEDQHHLLIWETASENNSDYFELQRSSDGQIFISIATKSAAGFSTQPKHYRHLDKLPAKGINYYRLKQVDQDGSSTFSSIISLNNKDDQSFNIYPNPTLDLLQIGMTESNKSSQINLYNSLGQIVLKQQLTANTTTTTLDLSLLSRGVYFLELNNGEEILHYERVIKN